jgi:hypothetical protein
MQLLLNLHIFSIVYFDLSRKLDVFSGEDIETHEHRETDRGHPLGAQRLSLSISLLLYDSQLG